MREVRAATVDLSPSLVEWLSLIRYQVLTAEEQSRQPAPSSVLAINTIQDAVEAILSLTLQHRGGVVRNKPDFLQLFDAVMDSLGKPDTLVAFRPSLVAMNTIADTVGGRPLGPPPVSEPAG